MSGERPEDGSEVVSAFAMLGNFKPKAPSPSTEVTKEIEKDINKVAEDNGFHSREAKPVQAGKSKRFNAAVPKKQLNIKIPLDMHERYYRMAEERGIKVLHELLGDALDALEEKEKAAKKPATDKV